MSVRDDMIFSGLAALGLLGEDICGALPPSDVSGGLIYCKLRPHVPGTKHKDSDTGWSWHGEREPSSEDTS